MMANAPTVVTHATSETPRIGKVLDGLKFFVVQRVPRRTGLLKDIEANGGHIVRFEAQCDYVIADHLRKDAPGGSYSYTLIDSAIKSGHLPDPADHATGGTLRSDRPVGSVVPGKHTRMPFTPQDDKDLWEFVEEAKQDGASVKGNDIYKQLEKVNPRHTFQAWRDRYIKKLMERPPPAGARAPTAPMAPSTSPANDDDETTTEAPSARSASSTLQRKRKVNFTDEAPETAHEDGLSPKRRAARGKRAQAKIWDQDLADLLDNAEEIEDIRKDRWWDAWNAFEQAHPHRSAEKWSLLYLTRVRPLYLQRNNKAVVARYDGADDTQGNAEPDTGPNCARDNAAGHSASSTPGAKKRKRTNQISAPAACLASHKRQRADSPPQEALANKEMLRSELNRDAEQQFQYEADTAPATDPAAEHPQSHTLPSSDANTAADRQLLAEAVTQELDSSENFEDDDSDKSRRSAAPEGSKTIDMATAISNTRSVPNNRDREYGKVNDRDLPTSEANKYVDEQLREIMQDDESEVQSQLDADDSELALTAENAAVQLTGAISDSAAGSQHALTEANLASQQAEHRPYIPRATDLPPDEEEKDQSEFIDYLQKTISKTRTPHDDGGTGGIGERTDGLRFDHVSPNFWQDHIPGETSGGTNGSAVNSSHRKPMGNVYISQLHRRQQEVRAASNLHSITSKDAAEEPKPTSLNAAEEPHLEQDLPMSSEQELDDALGDSLAWPASPQQNRSQRNTQGQTFETQIEYPKLDRSKFEQTGLAAPDFQLSSQSIMSQHEDGEDDTQAPPVLSFQQHLTSLQEHVPEAGNERSPAQDKPAAQEFLVEDDEKDDVNGEQGSETAADEHDDSLHQEVDSADGDVDLTVVEPDGGFLDPGGPNGEHGSTPKGLPGQRNEPITISSAASSSSPYQASADGEAPENFTRATKQALETQDILNAETQMPDLSMPEPSLADDDVEGDEEDGAHSQAPPDPPGQVAAQAGHSEGEEPDADASAVNMDTWISNMKARGFNDKAISVALKCTSYRPHLAQLVLYEEERGHGLPDDTPGIWSKVEDEILEGGDARKLRKLDEKHGSAECDARLQFLSEWREMFPHKS